MSDATTHNVCEAVVRLFAPFGEAIVHDIKSGTVAHVYGKHSTREVGEPSFLEDMKIEDWASDIQGPYRKTEPDGRSIKSISILQRDVDGAAAYLICINVDVSQFESARVLLSGLISVPDEEPNPLANDWLEKLNVFVADWTMERGIRLKDIKGKDRRLLVQELEQNGVFDQKNAAQAIAKVLGVSRATVYQDLRK